MILKTARKLVVLVIGGTALLLGAVMLVTPGTGHRRHLRGPSDSGNRVRVGSDPAQAHETARRGAAAGKVDPGATRAAPKSEEGSPTSPVCRP